MDCFRADTQCNDPAFCTEASPGRGPLHQGRCWRAPRQRRARQATTQMREPGARPSFAPALRCTTCPDGPDQPCLSRPAPAFRRMASATTGTPNTRARVGSVTAPEPQPKAAWLRSSPSWVPAEAGSVPSPEPSPAPDRPDLHQNCDLVRQSAAAQRGNRVLRGLLDVLDWHARFTLGLRDPSTRPRRRVMTQRSMRARHPLSASI